MINEELLDTFARCFAVTALARTLPSDYESQKRIITNAIKAAIRKWDVEEVRRDRAGAA